MLKSRIIIRWPFALQNCVKSVGPLGHHCWLSNVDIVGGRNALLTAVELTADMHCWPRLCSASNDFVGTYPRHFNASFCSKPPNKHCVTHMFKFNNIKRFYSADKNSMDLAERFRSDPEAKSFMQELLSDFERTEPITDEERTMVHEQIGDRPNPTQEKDTTIATSPRADENLGIDQHQVSEMSNLDKDEDGEFVFNIEEVVDMLKEENASDICAIQLPRRMKYADYMILATGRSARHLKAMAQHCNQKYKKMKAEHNKFLTIEGKNADDWMCIDFGNIVVHFMLEETREIYELEKLWTLGPEFDDQSQRMNMYEMRMFNEDGDLNTGKEHDTVDEGIENENRPPMET